MAYLATCTRVPFLIPCPKTSKNCPTFLHCTCLPKASGDWLKAVTKLAARWCHSRNASTLFVKAIRKDDFHHSTKARHRSAREAQNRQSLAHGISPSPGGPASLQDMPCSMIFLCHVCTIGINIPVCIVGNRHAALAHHPRLSDYAKAETRRAAPQETQQTYKCGRSLPSPKVSQLRGDCWEPIGGAAPIQDSDIKCACASTRVFTCRWSDHPLHGTFVARVEESEVPKLEVEGGSYNSWGKRHGDKNSSWWHLETNWWPQKPAKWKRCKKPIYCCFFWGQQVASMKQVQNERPAKCNTTKPGLFKQGIGFGSSLYRFTWFGVPCSDSCLLVWV